MKITSEEAARLFVGSIGDTDAVARIDRFVACLIEEAGRQNLIARSTVASIWQRHIADSAQLLQFVPDDPSGPWVDFGTGAGFPGVVIAALRPRIEVVLVEPRKMRVDWLIRMVKMLELSNCQVQPMRAESLPTLSAGVISARAFANLADTLRLLARFSTTRTGWLLPKGRSAAQELANLPEWQRKMFHVEQSLTDPDAGIVVGRGSAQR